MVVGQSLKNKLARINFIYSLLGPLKGMFWLSVLLMFLAAAWEGVILATMATFLQSLVDTTRFSASTFDADSTMGTIYKYYSMIPDDFRVLFGFVLTTMSILMGTIINAGLHTFQTGFSTRFIINVRCMVFNQLYRSTMTYFDNHKKGALITMVVNESRSCYNVLKTSLHLIIAALRVAVLIICMIAISIELTVIVVLFSAVFLLETVCISRILKRLSVVVVERTRALTVDADESIQGARLVKLFNLYGMMEASFRGNCSKADFTSRKQSILQQWQEAVAQIIVLASLFTLIYLNIKYSFVAVSLMVTYLYTLNKLNGTLVGINKSYGLFAREVPRLERVMEFMKERTIYLETSGGKVSDVLLKDRISFRDVCLRYGIDSGRLHNESVLKNINLDITRGQTVALVGESGSGKSSLANLVVRLYDVSEGEILIDGVNLREFDLTFLREKIGLVNQDTVLFNKTVRENIMIGKADATEEEMLEASRNAHVHEFVSKLPNGYDTIVGDRGVKLSGGQRQRINIAQIFLKSPEIMILDEATSALDSMSEQYIQEAFERLAKNHTSIIIAHRLSTVKSADLIVVLENGRIIEKGSWDELINKQNMFYEMVQLQSFEI